MTIGISIKDNRKKGSMASNIIKIRRFKGTTPFANNT
jgi:hypothetical protein